MTRPAERPYFLEGVEYIEILDGDGHYLQLPKLTTAQRDALSATEGMMIYNTDTGQVEAYQDGSWSAVSGAGTFTDLTDTPSSYIGRGGDVVLVKTAEDGIETQPWPVTGTILNFFLSDDAADIGSYYYMYPTESGNGYSELTSPSLSTGDDQLLWTFVTEAGEPGVEVLALGAYTATLFLKKTGNKDVRVYWKLFKRDSGGTETEILQSAVSDYLTADNSQYLISAYLNEDQVLDPTDRLVLKLYANVSGTGTDVTVTLTMEGDYDSRLTINVLSSAFNLDRLSDVTIVSPTDNELLAYDSGSGKWVNQTAGEAGILAADGSVPLSGDLNANGHAITDVLSLNSVRFADQYDVSDIGKGVNDAIADLPTDASGDKFGTVVIPPGEWDLYTTINLPGKVRLCGCGIKATVIKSQITDGSPVISLIGPNWDYHISSLCITGTGSDGHGIEGTNTPHRWNFENIFIDGVGGDGIHMEGAWVGKISNATFNNCTTGIYLGKSNGNETNNVTINACRIYYCTTGIIFDGSAGLSIQGGNIEHCTTAIHLGPTSATQSISIGQGLYLENNTSYGIRIQTASWVSIGPAYISIPEGATGIKIEAGENIEIHHINWTAGGPTGTLGVDIDAGVGEVLYYGCDKDWGGAGYDDKRIRDNSGNCIEIYGVDGTLSLGADFEIGNGHKLLADQIRARDADGLKLTDDAGNGIFVADGGNVGIMTVDPVYELDIKRTKAGVVRFRIANEEATDTASLADFLLGAYNSDAGGLAGFGFQVFPTQFNQFTWSGISLGGYARLRTDSTLNGLIFTTGGAAPLIFGTGDQERVRIDSGGNVGIGASPGYKLDVSGDIHCTGKLTSDGGNDPPYVLYNYETRTSIVNRVKKEVLPDKLNGAVLFFNGDQGQLELFLPSKGEFRSLDGKVLETVKPITQTFETEDRYYFDEETGEIKSYKVKKKVKRYRLKPDHELDPKTGKIKRKIKEKKKDPKTGEEIEEIGREEEVTPEEAIELVEVAKEDGR